MCRPARSRLRGALAPAAPAAGAGARHQNTLRRTRARLQWPLPWHAVCAYGCVLLCFSLVVHCVRAKLLRIGGALSAWAMHAGRQHRQSVGSARAVCRAVAVCAFLLCTCAFVCWCVCCGAGRKPACLHKKGSQQCRAVCCGPGIALRLGASPSKGCSSMCPCAAQVVCCVRARSALVCMVLVRQAHQAAAGRRPARLLRQPSHCSSLRTDPVQQLGADWRLRCGGGCGHAHTTWRHASRILGGVCQACVGGGVISVCAPQPSACVCAPGLFRAGPNGNVQHPVPGTHSCVEYTRPTLCTSITSALLLLLSALHACVACCACTGLVFVCFTLAGGAAAGR